MKKKLQHWLTNTRLCFRVFGQAISVMKMIWKGNFFEEIGLEEEGIEPMRQISNTTPISIPPINLKGLNEVSEDQIIMAAQKMGNTPNNFHMLLITSELYKSLDIEPVFLINKAQDIITVAAREIWVHPNSLN